MSRAYRWSKQARETGRPPGACGDKAHRKRTNRQAAVAPGQSDAAVDRRRHTTRENGLNMYAGAAARATSNHSAELTGRSCCLRGALALLYTGPCLRANSSARALLSHRSTATLVPAASRTLTCPSLGLGDRPREGLVCASFVAMLSIITHRATFGTQEHTHGTDKKKEYSEK